MPVIVCDEKIVRIPICEMENYDRSKETNGLTSVRNSEFRAFISSGKGTKRPEIDKSKYSDPPEDLDKNQYAGSLKRCQILERCRVSRTWSACFSIITDRDGRFVVTNSAILFKKLLATYFSSGKFLYFTVMWSGTSGLGSAGPEGMGQTFTLYRNSPTSSDITTVL
ncbi:hypothetical protein Tco_0286445 [Tanacetum coccineum]